jgi:phenylpropionate dioxygenase-like ring-hydroxylating dioxygenase large terminal subunit
VEILWEFLRGFIKMNLTETTINTVKASPSTAVLHDYWYPVAKSSEIEDKPFKFTLLDQPLVLWRANGQIAAFYDLCIHRGTPLSLGWIADGQLVCAYHGWQYRVDGACSLIPSLPTGQPIPAKAKARVFKAVEKYGLVWVCIGEPRFEVPEFPPEYYDPSFNWQPYFSEGRWNANAARMIENLADYSHFAWVHPGILGDRAHPLCPEVKLETIDGGFQYEIDTPVNRLNPDLTAKQRYVVILPFMLLIQRWQPGSVERHTNIYLCTPMTSKETRFFRFAGRNYRDHQPDDLLNQKHQTIFSQDKVIVEAQRPEELPTDLSEELHLKGPDTPAIEYRRRLRQLGIAWQ